MSDERIVAELVLDDGKYTVRMNGASKATKAFERDMMRLNTRMMKTEKATSSASFSLMKWTVIIGQARNALHQLWFITGQWMGSLIKTSSEIERMTSLMKGMSKAATEAGKASEAASNVSKLFEMASNAPFTVNALSDSFVKFKSVGLDPLDGSMNSLVDAVAAFGGTDETLHRASIAIQQMAGKGVISMEELRQQLGEAVPQAITIMAQSMGTTYGDLVDQISKGKVEAKGALEAMFAGFEIAFGGRAKGLMDNFTGRVAKMKTAWTQLVTGSSGVKNYFESIKDSVSSITELLNSDFAMNFMDGLGNSIAKVASGFSFVVQHVAYGYGQVEAFFHMVNTASLTEGNILYVIRAELEREYELLNSIVDKMYEITSMAGGDKPKNLIDFIFNPFGLISQETMDNIKDGTASLFLGVEDAADAGNQMLKRRMIAGADILDTELSNIEEVYNDHSAAILKKSQEIEAAKNALNRTIVSTTRENPLGDLEIFSQEQVEALRSRVESISGIMAGIDARRAAIQREILTTTAARDNGTMWNGEAERKLAELEEGNRKLIASYTKFFNDKKAITDRINSLQPPEVMYDEFGDKIIAGASDRLQAMADSSDAVLSAMARNVQKLNEELRGMTSDSEAMAQSVGNVIGSVADGLTEPFIENIEDFRSEMGSLGSDMLTEIQSAMTDTAGTAESRFATATEIANNFFDTQVAGYIAIGEVAQAELAKQGNAGLEAAAIVASQIAEMLKAIEEKRTAILNSVKIGIPQVTGGGSKSKGRKGKSAGQRAGERLKDMVKEANLAADEVAKRFANPFAYELPNAIDSARKKIQKLADDMSGGQWTSQMKSLFNTIAATEMTEEMIKMAGASRDIQRNLMGERERRTDIYDEEVRRIKEMKAKLIEMGIWRVEWEGTIQEQLLQLQEQYAAASPMGDFMNDWKNIYEDIEQVGADAMKSLSQGMADMVTEGKANFADLARSAVNSLLQVSFNAGLSGLTDLISSGISGWMGGGKTAASVNHGGGIIGQSGGRNTSVSSDLFSNARRYHTGGVIGQEVPAILEKGEGVFTPAQMKALGGGMSGQKETKVNIINNSGTQVESEESNARFTPDGMVLDIVLKRIQQPGPFRDNMKRALK